MTAQVPQIKLTSAPHPQPTLPELLRSIFFPAIVMLKVIISGLPRTAWEQFTSLSLPRLFSPVVWRDGIWGYGSPSILKWADETSFDARQSYLRTAYGRVLEVGAGSGEIIKYYDPERVEHLYALEPFPPLVKALQRKIAARGAEFEAKTTIVNHGIEEKDALEKKFGLTSESIDTLVLVQCLCSIPDPEKHLKEAVDLLKPGGKLILIEHVASKNPTTRFWQDFLTPLWAFFANGCELNRDTIANLRALGCWDDLRTERPDVETTAHLLPAVWVQAIKKK